MSPARFPRDRRPSPRLDALVDQVVRWLTNGRQDRGILVQRLGVSDRMMRKAIEEARRRGVLIITTPGPLHQYELAPSREEYMRWRQQEVMSRMGTFGVQLRAMDAQRDRNWPAEQLRMEGFDRAAERA